MSYVLALDQGTSSSRAIIFNSKAEILSSAQKETTLNYPKSGWVEQDPVEIWESQLSVALEAISKARISRKEISSIGITNQRESIVAWDRASGKVLYPAIIWQDQRSTSYCNKLLEQGFEKIINNKTGLLSNPYFSATKMKWLLEQVDAVAKAAEKGTLSLGTIDCWLLYNLTGGTSFATDHTNASRTMLYNIHTASWDTELLNHFGIPEIALPHIGDSSSYFGTAVGELKDMPICGIAGDQHAALLGQCCTQEGMIKNTYGTGCFILLNTGTKATTSTNKLLTTLSYEKLSYALEGSVFTGGAAVRWLRDGLGLIQSSTDIEELASSVHDSGGVHFVPAFNGLGAPYWDTEAKAIISGISANTKSGHLARATLESMAFQSADVIQAMSRDTGKTPRELRVDGGAAVNDLLLQFQADILDIPVIRPHILETTALGAAFLAGLASDIWSDWDEIEENWKAQKIFEPTITQSKREELLDAWLSAIKKSRHR